MLAFIALAALYAAWHAGRSAFEALRSLPRSNEDMVFF
jgi:hypothetical protein